MTSCRALDPLLASYLSRHPVRSARSCAGRSRRARPEPHAGRVHRHRCRSARCWCRWWSATGARLRARPRPGGLPAARRRPAGRHRELREPAPRRRVSLVFLQDLSGSMGTGRQDGQLSREAVAASSTTPRPGDEFALATFASGAPCRSTCRSPRTSRRAARGGRELGSLGHTALHDAVAWLPEISLGSAQRQARRDPGHRRRRQRQRRSRPEQARELVRQAAAAGLRARALNPAARTSWTSRGKKVYRYADMLQPAGRDHGRPVLPDRRARRPEGACAAIARGAAPPVRPGVLDRGERRGRPTTHLRVEVRGRGSRACSFRRGYTRTPAATSAGVG